jgi:hypothetical protein
MPEIDITDTDYAASRVADGVFMGAVAGEAAQFQTADFAKCRTPVTLTATATLDITALNNLIYVNAASAATITIPPVADVAWPLGARITFVRLGAGEVTIGAGSGVTRRSSSNQYRANAQYSAVQAIHMASDEWVLFGDKKV